MMSDPVRVLFVNENLGGHAAMHLFLRDSLAAVAPHVDARFLDVPPSGWIRRISSARMPVLGKLDLDLQPLRFQLAQSEIVRRQLAHAGDYDVLHLYTQSIGLRSIERLAAGPSVVSTDATLAQGAFHLPYRRPTRFTGSAVRVSQRFERRVYAAATLVVAQSEWTAESLRTAYGVPADRVRVVPFGLSVGPAPVRVAPEGLPEVTFVGSTMARKGGTRLVRAFRKHLQGRCVLNLVTKDAVLPERGIRVFSDFLPGDARLPELLARSAIFAFPTEMDNSPYAVLEAMRAALPVVATRVGAVPEMVVDELNGVLVPHDDDALAGAIGRLLDDPEWAVAMGKAGRARVEEIYSADRTSAQLVEVLAEARDRFGVRSPA
jgi:glycosyltransferase involved in cell wall biosynthesis